MQNQTRSSRVITDRRLCLAVAMLYLLLALACLASLGFAQDVILAFLAVGVVGWAMGGPLAEPGRRRTLSEALAVSPVALMVVLATVVVAALGNERLLFAMCIALSFGIGNRLRAAGLPRRVQ